MKIWIMCLFLPILLLAILGCSKNESPATNTDPCAKGKFLYPWCSPVPVDLAVIQVLDTAIGGDFISLNKVYKNTVLVHLDKALLSKGTNWSGVISSSDSIFSFTYTTQIQAYNICEICCPPKINIRITSILSTLCPPAVN
jgi:hypothetical protein